MICTACGKEIDKEKRFCGYCGMSVENPAAQEAEVTTEQLQKKHKIRGKKVLLVAIVYFVIIVALFSYFYISLRGWGGVPLINKLHF
ncbi:MAG: zinc-ribbon domain-containing protein [Anaerolineaceae bacterium]|nr:MAG: zinc-ribbon domain-containing protein [Anaerolineaceae bacterium]